LKASMKLIGPEPKALVMETHWTDGVFYRAILYSWTFLLN